MNRRWLAVVSGLIVSSSVTATAWGQSPARQPSLAERMAALRHGWTGGSQQQATNDSSNAASSSTTEGGVPQVDGRSLIPGNFLNRRTGQQQPAARVPAPAGNSGTPRVASRPRAGSAEATGSSTQGFTLPGLGGSRLPSAATNSSQQNRTQSQPGTDPATTTRYGNSTARSPQASQPTARRSPQHRTALNVNPRDLSRELAGSFPTEPQASAATDGSTGDNEQPTPADSSLSLPAADDDSATTPQLKVVAPSNENADHDDNEA